MASVKPTAFAGDEYIRIGSYKKKLKDFPEKERALWQSFETMPYEMRTAKENVNEEEVTRLLDCAWKYDYSSGSDHAWRRANDGDF